MASVYIYIYIHMAKSPSWGMIVSFLVNTFSALMKQEGPLLWMKIHRVLQFLNSRSQYFTVR